MTYATFISQLRVQSGDLAKTVAADWVADGTTGVLLLPLLTFPVMAGSYTVKRNGVTMTENTDYTLDKETGRIVVALTPTAGDIFNFIGQRVALTDDAWIVIINDVIRAMTGDFFKEVTDTTSYVSTANMRSLLLSGFIDVYDMGTFYGAQSNTNRLNAQNWRFSQDEQKVYFGDYGEFPTGGQVISVRGIKSYTLGAVGTDTLDVQDKYIGVLKLGSIAQYWRYKLRENVENLGKITQETTRTPNQELLMLADRYDRWYQIDYQKLAPAKPLRIIPVFNPRKGRA